MKMSEMSETSRPTIFTILRDGNYKIRPYHALMLHGARRDGQTHAYGGSETEAGVRQQVQEFYGSQERPLQQLEEQTFYRIRDERKQAGSAR